MIYSAATMIEPVSFAFYYLPYCLTKVAPRQWIVLNRDYKPLGTYQFAEYSEWALPLAITSALIRKVAVHTQEENGEVVRFWLYNGNVMEPTCSPKVSAAYFTRLQQLSAALRRGRMPREIS